VVQVNKCKCNDVAAWRRNLLGAGELFPDVVTKNQIPVYTEN
jgi:hypothetical protein